MTKYTVLLVEDHPIASKIARLTLSELNCLVDLAQSGQEALRLFEEKNYDLVFMDIGLPDISGFEVTSQMRKNEHKTVVPIIALTAHDDEKIRYECQEAGMVDFLPKPITREKVLHCLRFYCYHESIKKHNE